MGRIKTVAGSGYGSVYVDSLIWGGQAWDANDGPIRYHFGSFSELPTAQAAHNGNFELGPADVIAPWSEAEERSFREALAIYSSVCNVTFEETADVASAEIVWWLTFLPTAYGKHETPADGMIWGFFDFLKTDSWSHRKPGGDGFNTIMHELGHAMGLAHPHDGGSQSDRTRFPGVTSSDDLGTGAMNQGVYTVMSYNQGYSKRDLTDAYGAQGGLGALDIAALQQLYGANTNTRTGDDVYVLPSANRAGTGWSSIWDAGGTDTISAAGATKGADIDLRAATLQRGAGAGGFVSADRSVSGGFTIAKDVVIERALGRRSLLQATAPRTRSSAMRARTCSTGRAATTC